jgi:hypothetical protein
LGAIGFGRNECNKVFIEGGRTVSIRETRDLGFRDDKRVMRTKLKT